MTIHPLAVGGLFIAGAWLLFGERSATATEGETKPSDGATPTGGTMGTTDTRPGPGQSVVVTDGEGHVAGTAVGNADGSVTTTTLGGSVVTEPPIGDIEIHATPGPMLDSGMQGHGIPSPPSLTYGGKGRPVKPMSPRQQSIKIAAARNILKLRY